MLTDSVFLAIVHLQKVRITVSLDNVPDSQSYTYRRKYYHLFKLNVLSAHDRKNEHITLSYLIKFW